VHILIYGAGTTGCYIAAQCLEAGVQTSLVCRSRIKEDLKRVGGLRYSDHTGKAGIVALPNLHTALPDLSSAHFDLCLVTLKCHHLENALDDLVQLANAGCELHFLQNGLNAYQQFPQLENQSHCYSGIIPFNVVMLDDRDGIKFHQGTEGALQLQSTDLAQKLDQAYKSSNMALSLYQDIQPVVYGKLLLNLNNAINALSDMPLKEQLENRSLRLVVAATMREYLAVCKLRKQNLVISAPIPPALLPAFLSLPNFLFKRAAKSMLAIDPLARSSMWEDIQADKKTEIQFLNGMVVRLAKEEGIACPVNERVCGLIEKLENGDKVELSELYT
jgi:2-dehydropantoate 2-reductase